MGVSSDPPASSPGVAARMSVHPRRDTVPELAVRRLLHGRGLRYRVEYRVPANKRRTIDIAFTRARVAVFIDGCFWHGCSEHGRAPTANADWWRRKLAGNQARDAHTSHLLESSGWRVLRFWAHEEPMSVADRVQAVVQASLSRTKDRCPDPQI